MNGPTVFLSYAREDKPIVISLSRVLRANGFCTWLDVEDIVPGERWEDAIERALERADFIVLCLSRQSVSKRGFAQREIRRALRAEEEMLEGDIFLIPVRLDTCEMPARLRAFQWIDAATGTEFSGVVSALVEGCRRRGLALGIGALSEETPMQDEPSQVDLSQLGGAGFLARFRLWGHKKSDNFQTIELAEAGKFKA